MESVEDLMLGEETDSHLPVNESLMERLVHILKFYALLKAVV